jgi:23S rRNA pseudouridine1911/1915/1917 synthase
MNTTCFTVDEALSDQRLDVAIVSAVSSISRSRAQQSIRDGHVQVNGHAAKASCRVHIGDQVTLDLPEPVPIAAEPEDIALDIVYEDAWVIVVTNRPILWCIRPAAIIQARW